MKSGGEAETSKLCTLEAALKHAGVSNGMTISFHHHLRNGDAVMALTFEALSKLQIRDITVAASSLSKVQDCLVKYIEDGTITAIYTSGIRSKLAYSVQHTQTLKAPVELYTHGGRARAIASGQLQLTLLLLQRHAVTRLEI